MSELDLRGVHVFRKERGTSQFRLAEVHPLMRIAQKNAAGLSEEIFIQNGRYWTAGGEQIRSRDLPEWAREQLSKASKTALAECGIHVDRKDEQTLDS